MRLKFQERGELKFKYHGQKLPFWTLLCIFTSYTREMRVIKTEQEYESALERLNDIFDAPVDSPEGDEAELLTILIENFEQIHYPIEAPDPIEAIKFRIEQMNMSKKDLAEVIGYKSRVSEILSKKRRLSLSMIRKLHKKLHIPYESLMSEY